MLQVTKIFRFEMAHALNGYAGDCCYIHGHSYTLHVTIASREPQHDFLQGTGVLYDFKELKKLVNETVINQLDHQLVLSEHYLEQSPLLTATENLRVWKIEPSAENMLIYIHKALQAVLPENIFLKKLKIFETNDSYAEWEI